MLSAGMLGSRWLLGYELMTDSVRRVRRGAPPGRVGNLTLAPRFKLASGIVNKGDRQ